MPCAELGRSERDNDLHICIVQRRWDAYRQDICVAHDGVGQSKRDNDLDFEWGDVAVDCDVLHGVQQIHVAIRRFGSHSSGD